MVGGGRGETDRTWCELKLTGVPCNPSDPHQRRPKLLSPVISFRSSHSNRSRPLSAARMSFSSSHSVTIPHPLALTLTHLASPSTNEAVARLSPILTVYEDLGIERVWITDDDLSPEMEGRRDLGSLELAPEGSEIGQERAGGHERVVERLRYRIVNEVVIPLYTHRVDTPGLRVFDPKVRAACGPRPAVRPGPT
jgi:hypothetical protein